MRKTFTKYRHTLRNFAFIAALWLGLYLLVEAGVFGGRYQYNAVTETSKSYIDINLISLSIPIFLIAIFLNPFYDFWKKPSQLQQITGLEEFHWEQARAAIDRYGEEAPKVLAIREGDDVLIDDQKRDFRKSRLAAETILKAKNIGE